MNHVDAPRALPRRLRDRLHEERGNALVEFVVLAVVLLIPSLYLVLSLGGVQSALFAADEIARDAARIHAVEADPGRAEERVRARADLVLGDHGLARGDVVELVCSEDPCATPGGEVRAQVRIPVPVPGLGPVLGMDGLFTVGSDHLVLVDQYRAPQA